MKIIQVQTQAEAAGAQRVSDMVGDGLRARGHDVRTVFMYRKTDVYDQDPHADFVSTNKPKGKLDEMRAALGLIRHLRREKPDAVITYQYWGNLFGTIGARLAGVKTIVVNQSGRPLSTGLLGLVCRFERLMGIWGWFDYTVVNSAWTQKQFDAYPKAYKKRMRLIEHGVIGPEEQLDKKSARVAFDLPKDVPLVLSTGRQTKDKNQTALVAALVDLPDVHMGIAGVGPLHDELIAYAKKLGVDGRLHMVGEVAPSRIHAFLAAGDLFAFASLDETFGLSVAEAGIAGLPIVSNDLLVLREVLQDEAGQAAALFVSPPEGPGFAKAISQVLNDAKLAADLSAAGRALAVRYHPDAMCGAYEELLKPRG
jgi:glycosyltransferase involved in cell wall biosynthesis